MIVSNNNIYVVKCYINFFYIVADKMQGLTVLANAINNFKDYNLKKIITKTLFVITHFLPRTFRYSQLISL